MTGNTFEFKGRAYYREQAGRYTKIVCIGPAKPVAAPPAPTDPVELIVHRALVAAEVPFTNDPNLTNNLDFKLLTEPAIYIECKQFHSPRITEQMTRAKDVIAVQGIEAAHFFARVIQVTTRDARHFRVSVGKDILIVLNRYQNITEFAAKLKYNWEHNLPIELHDGSTIMVNPAFIETIDGPHDIIFTIKWQVCQ